MVPARHASPVALRSGIAVRGGWLVRAMAVAGATMPGGVLFAAATEIANVTPAAAPAAARAPIQAPALVPGPAVVVARPPAAVIDIAAESAQIDALVAAGLQAHHASANPPATDAVFLRRIYLDCIGRIPTFAEADAFFSDGNPNKRSDLIARLQSSEGWVSHQFNWWADLLRVQSYPMGGRPADTYIDWIKQQIRADVRFDVMVRALLTAKGPILARGNGATGYYVRDANMAMDNMSNTVQVFLGTRLACAQCHDHPFDVWTRRDYLQMAAFISTVNAQSDADFGKALQALTRNDHHFSYDPLSVQEKDSFRRYTTSVEQVVADRRSDAITLPKDYQYNDAKPGTTVHAHAIFGNISVKKGEDPRVVYAAWMTAPDNPRFTTVIANRMWKKTFGRGLIEPVDNITAQTVSTEPELMANLTALMLKTGYDLKTFQAILFNTRAYQSATSAVDPDAGEPYYFSGPLLRRMGAEEVWDSLLTLVVPDLDERTGAGADPTYAFYEYWHAKSPMEIWQVIAASAAQIRERHDVQEREKALLNIAGSLNALKNNAESYAEYNHLTAREKELNGALAPLQFTISRNPAAENTRWNGFRRDLLRASELASPAPPGHLLRDFGQFDRMLVENSNATASVPQALTLLNGFVDGEVLRPHAQLIVTINAQKTPEARIRAAFLSIFTREPTAKELAWALGEAAKGDPAAPSAKSATAATATPVAMAKPNQTGVSKGTADVLWSLINTDEFLFEQ